MPSGVWGSGVLSGVAADLLTVCEFSSGWDGYILRSGVFQRKNKDSKKCDIIQFLHIFLGVISCQFPSGCRPTVSRWRSARAIYSTIFRWLPDLNELLSVFSACYLSSVAVLRSVVGAESVKLRQAVRRSSYISICIHRYSVAFATFFNLLCINCITLFTLCIISILFLLLLYLSIPKHKTKEQ